MPDDDSTNDAATMNWAHLWAEPMPIPMHALAALAATALGGVQLALPKGTRLHRLLGMVWAALMASVAVSGFWIYELPNWARFSPIHLLSLVTLILLGVALHAAHCGQIRRHQRIMTRLYWLGLIVTGLFTFWPGRVMHAVLFAGG